MSKQEQRTQEQKNRRALLARKRWKEDPEGRQKRLASAKKWREANPNHGKEWKRANPDKVKKYNLKKNHNMSLEEYRILQVQQDNRCAICFEELGDKLRVDHCHSSEKVRGLLCNPCNRGLGFFRDIPSRLRSAADYLERTASPT